MPHRFDPANMQRLLAPERAAWLRPDVVLQAMDLHSGSRVLDFGCGPGVFTLPLTAFIGDSGAIVGADLEPAMLGHLDQRSREARLDSIAAVLCDGALPFQNDSFDRVLASLVYHEIDDGAELLREFARVLRSPGLLALVEWHPWHTEHGPDVSQRISPARMQSELRTAGLTPHRELSLSGDVYLQIAIA